MACAGCNSGLGLGLGDGGFGGSSYRALNGVERGEGYGCGDRDNYPRRCDRDCDRNRGIFPFGYPVALLDRYNDIEISLHQHGEIESDRDRMVDCNGCDTGNGNNDNEDKGCGCKQNNDKGCCKQDTGCNANNNCPEVKPCPKPNCSCNCCGGKPKIPELSFETCLTFEQVLICKCRHFVPRSKCDAPGNIFGKFKICFNRGMTRAYFALSVFNDFGKTNPNTRVTRAALHAGRADEVGPIIVNLYRSGSPRTGNAVNGSLRKGYITNQNIRKIDFGKYSFSSVASLYDAVRRGEVYVQVDGASIDFDRVQYQNGLLRGQIFARETA